jgi:very-short-patch-repair endonuclease
MTEDKPQPFKTPQTGELWGKLKPLAREKRHEPTQAENTLWQCLRRHHLAGFQFRRQHAIDRFIVDFFCAAAYLVIEVDGPIHDYTPEEDAIRQEFLESLGLRVIRFTNEPVIGELDEVLKYITEVLLKPLPPALPSGEAEFHADQVPSPPGGEGI